MITSPIKDLTNARATVGVRDGQTIVLGGMITNSKEQVERKVPFLGDIPVWESRSATTLIRRGERNC